MNHLWIASDHAGFELKEKLVHARPNLPWKNLGPANTNSVDYPDFADLVAKEIQKSPTERGVLICGSGQGMAIRANKYPLVRAAVIWSDETTLLSRQHNDANILCVGARFHQLDQVSHWLDLFLKTEFEGGRHLNRTNKLSLPLKT